MIGEKKKDVVYMGSDHAGYEMKGNLKKFLEDEGYAVTDLGTFSEEPYDYPDIAREVSEKVLERKGARGVLLCGTGIGVSISANKLRGIRCVNARDEKMAEMGRKHNDANILAMGAREVPEESAKKILLTFLDTDFDGEERHLRRVKKIDFL